MKTLRHHDFFQLYLPIDRDYSKIELIDTITEEFHMVNMKGVNVKGEYDNPKKCAFDVPLYPSFIYTSKEFHKDNGGQFQYINDCIDSEFVNLLYSIKPVYRIMEVIDYHYENYNGEKELFHRHLKYSIIENLNQRKKIEKFDSDKLELIINVINEWLEKMNDKKNISSNNIEKAENVIINNNSKIGEQKIDNKKISKFNNSTIKIIGIIIAFLSLFIAIISNWEKIKQTIQ